jgi:hypothetical protein
MIYLTERSMVILRDYASCWESCRYKAGRHRVSDYWTYRTQQENRKRAFFEVGASECMPAMHSAGKLQSAQARAGRYNEGNSGEYQRQHPTSQRVGSPRLVEHQRQSTRGEAHQGYRAQGVG